MNFRFQNHPIFVSIAVLSLFMVSFFFILKPYGLAYNQFSWLNLSNAYENTTLTMNYTSGAPGSYFSVRGYGYPAGSTATVSINGVEIGTVSVDGTGSFLFLLTTTNSDEGVYYITVAVNPEATSRFVLDDAEPLRAQEDLAVSLDVPPDIATFEIYLPTVHNSLTVQ
jgi:hypothetical protein